jgi:CheY-like chemotaxis protein
MPTHILVVDDDEMLREVVSAMLEGEGRIIDTASSGPEGLAAVTERRPDLMLLDLTMPTMSGWEVIDRLSELTAPPAVVAMSGMDLESTDLFTVRPFVYGFLSKPFNQDQLMRTCLHALEAARSPRGAGLASGERRSEARRALVVPAALHTPEGIPAAQGQILNLSDSGAELDLGAALEPGMKVALAFDIPGGRGAFRVTARVTWKKEGKLGLAFVDVPEEDRQRLAGVLAAS